MTVTIVPVEDPERVRAELREFKRQDEALQTREPELSAAYPNEWVALHDDRVFHAPDLAELLSELESAGLDPAHTAVAYLAIDLPPMLF
jgi:hypothetical protein